MKSAFKWLLRGVGLAVLLVLLLQLYFFVMIGWYAHVDPSSTSFMHSQMALVREKNPNREDGAAVGAVRAHLGQPEARRDHVRGFALHRARRGRLGCDHESLRK